MDTEPRPNLKMTPELGLLNNLALRIPEFATLDRPSITEAPETERAVLDGHVLTLNIKRNSFILEQDVYACLQIDVSTENSRNFSSVNISISRNLLSGECIGTTNVENKARKMKEVGRALWLFALKFMQQSADKLNTPIVHLVVNRHQKGLTDSQWDELFSPLLNEHGYVQKKDIEPHTWEKIYLPHTK